MSGFMKEMGRWLRMHKSMQLLSIMASFCCCGHDTSAGYVGAFARCSGAGEASNLRLGADRQFRWSHDGCDYTSFGGGTWSPSGTGIRLVSSGDQSRWLLGSSEVVAEAVDGGLTLDNGRGLSTWVPSMICATCQVNTVCRVCSNPVGFD
jgi:hypothetical protein